MSDPGSAESLKPFAASFGRDRDAVHRDLVTLQELVENWQRVQNLVSRETLRALWSRHIVDSLQLLAFLHHAPRVLDLGSGGGFPALPLAIATKSRAIEYTLIESNSRKCAFLTAAKREFGLDITVVCARIETAKVARTPEVVTARALTGLSALVTHAQRFAGPETRYLFHKGREYGEELARLDSALQKRVIQHDSITDAHGVILEFVPPVPGA